ncbi:conserved hypothetical protein [Arthrobacter sp. Hiyo6]|nr:conserved hypothetical protein [Arthrobacter sp. Hiyo6]
MSETVSAPTTDLEELIDSSIASRESRVVDFDTLKFQTKMGDKFRRGQVRYIGSGAPGTTRTITTSSRQSTSRSPTWFCRPGA